MSQFYITLDYSDEAGLKLDLEHQFDKAEATLRFHDSNCIITYQNMVK